MDNDKIIAEFRENEGKVGGFFEGRDLLLLHVTGAKSGKEYIKPLAYGKKGDDFVVFASMGGAPKNPAWYFNLVAQPDTTVEVGTETFKVHAREAKGVERDELYAEQEAKWTNFKDYREKTDRVIPVFVLEKV